MVLAPSAVMNIRIFNRGFSLFEVVVAIGILAFVSVGGLAALISLVRSSAETVKEIQATALLVEGVEAVKFMRDSGWATKINNLNRGTNYQLELVNGAWSATTTASNLLTDFSRVIKIENAYRDSNGDIVSSGSSADQYLVLLTVTVSWPPIQNTRSKTIQTYVANVFEN